MNARKVILATNGYTAHLYPKLQGVIVPLRGFVTAQRPGKAMPAAGLSNTYSFIYRDGYEYMIPRPPGTKFAGDIVIGGGLTKVSSLYDLQF
jgi:glycine/D-amino acid oxidase-like deaminating enzyme